MKEQVLIDPSGYPYVTFGENPPREIRMPVGPEITDDIRIVTTTIPPMGISEGHFHSDSDEFIRFDIPGEALVDGVKYQVPAGGIIYARKGMMHECRNTDIERTLTLYCVFVPAFAPYGRYPELIENTREYLEKLED